MFVIMREISPTIALATIQRYALALGQLLAIIVSPVFGLVILVTKKIMGFKAIGYIFGTFVLAIFGGVILGFLIPAFLTTRRQFES